MNGAESFITLLFLAMGIFVVLGTMVVRLRSTLLSTIALGGFGIIALLGFSTADTVVALDTQSILAVKIMGIVLLIGASIFTLRLRDAMIFLLSIIIAGIFTIYPNVAHGYLGISLVTSVFYLICSLLVPYVLTATKELLQHRPFLLASLPLSALVVSYGVYQIGEEQFP